MFCLLIFSSQLSKLIDHSKCFDCCAPEMALVRKIIGNAKPRLALFKEYAKAELAPPLTPAELKGCAKAFGHLGQSIVKGRFLLNTTASAATNLLVGVEIVCWFFFGEILGRRSIIGYNV